MSRTLKKAFSLLLAMTIVFGATPLNGLGGLDLPGFYGFKRIFDSLSVCFDDFSTKAEATQDYANKTYNAIFYLDEAKTQVYEIVPTAYNEIIEFPQNPSMDGLYFDGWDNNETVMGEGDIEFVALWINIEYTLTFINEEGEYIDSLTCYWGDQIYKEDIEAICEYYYNGKPTKEGYELKYWTGNGEPVIFPFEVKGDTVFEPYFSINTYDINYFVDGQLYGTDRYTFGDSISLREPIYIEGYTFSDWKDETGNDMVLPSTMPAKDINVHGTFTAIKYKAVFNAGDGFFSDGSSVKEVMVDYGQTPEVPESPTKEGELFLGWNPRLNPIGIHGAQYTAVFGKEYAYYTIEIYKMSEEGQYELTEVSQLIGNKNGAVSYAPEAIEGYAVDSKNSVLNGYVAADGSTTLKVYYMRTEFDQESTEKYKNATITLDKNSYTVKEPNSLTIEGTITCPDGVEGLLMSWSFDEIDIFYASSQTTYETISETELRFSQTFTPKEAGQFKVYARLPNGTKAECTVTSYQEAVSAFISEHYQFVKSDKYNDFVAEEAAQKMSKAVRGSFNYHWNNAMSWNYFENYYDLVFAELLTDKTMTETAVSTFNKNCAVQTTTISNEFLRFMGEGLKEDETKEFLSLLKSKDFVNGKDSDSYQQINLIIEANKKDITESFFAKYDIIGATNKILSVSTDYVEWAIECIYFYSAVEAYRQTNEEFKAVIKAVAEKTDNKSLKKTLETYISIDEENSSLSFAQYVLENRKTESLITMVKIFYDIFGVDGISKFICGINLKDGTKLGDKVVKVFTKQGTKVGTIAQYANGAITGITLGTAVSELITNADDYSMNASKCTHAGDFAEVLLEVLNESASNFKANKTLEDALLFDAAYNLYKDTQIYALNAMVESVYAQNNSVVRLLFNKAESVSTYMSKICKYKYLNCHKHDLTELINAEYYYVDKKYLGNKVLRIACPVDVYVYDSEGNLALSIENDFVEIFDDRLTAFVQDSEKYICVPLDEEFEIKIVSTDDGEMDYSVFEFDENSEMTREVFKENISLVNGKTFEGKIDNIINTDADNYSLIVTDTQENIAMDNVIDCVPATNISISKSSVELKAGQSQGLVASISPINTTDKYVWISSDESVATVSENGTVNAVGEGCAFIVAMVNDLIYAECEVSVVILKDYTVTWNIDGATTQQTITEGNTITKPANPTKSGYTFVGWSPEVPDTMPSYDLTFTAVFEKSYICPDCGNEILGEDAINEHIAAEARMKATIKIQNNSGSKTINYGETLRLTAIISNMPADVKICWYIDGVKKGEGETFNVSFESGTKTVEVKLVDSNNNVLKNASGNEISDSESVTVKGGFFQKIISFFKNLFGMNRTIVQAFKVIF